jgi:exodeoxyribonuclease VII large subunit
LHYGRRDRFVRRIAALTIVSEPRSDSLWQNPSFTKHKVWYNSVMQVRSVTQITQYLKQLIDDDGELADLWVEGEISNFSRAVSGHCYFTLKDDACELRCVLWRTQASRLSWAPRQGIWVEAHGHVSIYERGGVYQFYADALNPGGTGARQRELEALKMRLLAQGLFAVERKRPLPLWPQRIGVVTSPTGAAFQDILKVLRERYPLVEVVLAPSVVQGDEAPEALVRAIQLVNAQDDIDVLIVARGGGSTEDLWAFNDERVVRAVVASRIPVVSGVGHEVDSTLTDFAADLRTPTPSAAASAVVPDARELRVQLSHRVQMLQTSFAQRSNRLRELLGRQRRLLRQYDPQKVIEEQRQRIDDLLHRAGVSWEHIVALQRMSLTSCVARLQVLNPRTVLARGYAVVRASLTGATLTRIQQVAPGQAIRVYLYDGCLDAQVTRVHEHEKVIGDEEA